jgi:GTP-binding protein
VTLELKMIADVGLVGFPNVGNSTFLSRVTNARPKIANYHFTTLSPNLGVVDLPDGRGFVIADIPGIIEGASEGVGLGLDFLRHIERTRVIIHMVDGAGVEGRDPVEDIAKINAELEAYNKELASRPQVIAANKMDTIPEGEQEVYMDLLREAFGDPDIPIFPISAVSGKGVKELLYHVRGMLDELGEEKIVFEREYYPQEEFAEEPYSVSRADDGAFLVEGPRIERMLGYTNLESEKGFDFFQKFLKENGILKELEDLGIQDGDTVRLYGLEFEYWR